MPRTVVRPLWFALVVALAALALLLYTRLQAASTGVGIGQRPPVFTLPSVDGRMVSLRDFAGKPAVLNFFATWCGPCKAETPILVRYAEQYRGKVAFVGIDLTASESDTAAVRAFVKTYRIPYPVLLDRTGSVAVAYMVATIPVTFVLDRHGVIQEVYRVSIPAAGFGQLLRTLAG